MLNGEADVGIPNFDLSLDRKLLVEFSQYIRTDDLLWISATPRKLSPATNLIRIFDHQSLTMIGFSILSVSVVLIIITRIGQMYGVETPLDNFLIFIFPLGTLTAENLSSSFRRNMKNNKMKIKKKKKGLQSLFSPGFAGNGVLLLWTVMASFISMAFLSMIRATLLRPSYEPPIDSSEDIFKQDKIPTIFDTSYVDRLIHSGDDQDRKAGKY